MNCVIHGFAHQDVEATVFTSEKHLCAMCAQELAFRLGQVVGREIPDLLQAPTSEVENLICLLREAAHRVWASKHIIMQAGTGYCSPCAEEGLLVLDNGQHGYHDAQFRNLQFQADVYS